MDTMVKPRRLRRWLAPPVLSTFVQGILGVIWAATQLGSLHPSAAVFALLIPAGMIVVPYWTNRDRTAQAALAGLNLASLVLWPLTWLSLYYEWDLVMDRRDVMGMDFAVPFMLPVAIFAATWSAFNAAFLIADLVRDRLAWLG